MASIPIYTFLKSKWYRMNNYAFIYIIDQYMLGVLSGKSALSL